MSNQPFVFKGEMTLVSVLSLQSADEKSIGEMLRQKQNLSPLFFKAALVVDCQGISDTLDQLNFKVLREVIQAADFVPIGLRNLPEHALESAIRAGWAILRPTPSAKYSPPTTSIAIENVAPPAHSAQANPQTPAVNHLVLIDKPVRSGQQVCALQGDIVVLQHTSAGSELLASGSVHVYGSLRGRVLAGILGDTRARIFCQKLEAELVAIAGRYRLLDEVETPLKGQAAMIYLEGEKLMIEPMS